MAVSVELHDYDDFDTIECGDSRYTSPEAVRGCVRDLKYHLTKSDIYSLCCTIFELSTRKALTPESNELLRTSVVFPADWETIFSQDFSRIILVGIITRNFFFIFMLN